MQRNTVKSIRAALKEYDGCEFDVRLTRDRVPVMVHNARFRGKRFLDIPSKALDGVVDRFQDLLEDKEVVDLVNNQGKTLWIEMKEDTQRGMSLDRKYCRTLSKRVTNLLVASEIDLEKVHYISFCPQTLDHHSKGIKAMPIVPYLNCASDSFYPHRNTRTVVNMFTPITKHLEWAKKSGYSGLLFTKLYFRGFFSKFNPPLKDIIKKYQKKDFILGTEAQTKEDEEFFKDIVAITDYKGKRKKRHRLRPEVESPPEGQKRGKGSLVCHRGLGTDPD